MTVGLAVAVAVLLVALEATVSRADNPAPTISPNWSGYVVQGPDPTHPINYTSVTGTWTVSAATCDGNSTGGFSSTWIGLGGYSTKRQEEVGTDSNCLGPGKPTYYAWFELVPFISYNVPATNKIQAGDTMTGLVKVLSISLLQLQISDVTRGWSFSRNITYYPEDTTSAEWVVESPVSCIYYVCHQTNLTNFGSMTMQSLSAVGNGKSGNLNDSDWTATPIQLVPSNVLLPNLNYEPVGATAQGHASSPAGAVPGAPSADGSSFTDTWIPVSTKGV